MKSKSNEETIRLIENSIRYAVENDQIKEFGLLNGLAGVALFFLYRGRSAGFKDRIEFGQDILENVVRMSYDSTSDLSFCTGLSGIGWFIQHINNEGFDIDADYILSELDGEVAESMLQDIKESDFDFLHGAMGKFYYLLQRTHVQKNIKYLKEAVRYISEVAEVREGEIFWYFYDHHDHKIQEQVNLGMSHGMTSVPVLLSMFYRYVEPDSKVEEMVNQSINHIINQLDFAGHWVAPFFSGGNRQNGRLAWCYGDVGLAICLTQTGLNFNNRKWMKLGIKIGLNCVRKKDPMNNRVLDACICHGTSGLSIIYDAIGEHSRNVEFNRAAQYWRRKTIDYSKMENDTLGYLYWDHSRGWIKMKYGLLEGLVGVGLSLISKSDSKLKNWEKCLLIR